MGCTLNLVLSGGLTLVVSGSSSSKNNNDGRAGMTTTWSDVMDFISPPVVDASSELPEPFSYVVYADQGCPDDGWGEGGNWTATMMEWERVYNGCRAIHHFGDLSYAQGAAHIWDAWMQMIQPFASRMPFMIAIGNHVRIIVAFVAFLGTFSLFCGCSYRI